MTNEHEQQDGDLFAGTEATISVSVGIPDVPYSSVKANLPAGSDPGTLDDIAMRVVEMAANIRAQMLGAFPFLDRDNIPERPPERGGEGGYERGYERQAPPRQQRPQQRPQAGGGRPGGGQRPVAYCAEHNMAPVFLSAPKYNADGDRCYHPLDRRDQYQREGRVVQNHNMYWRETVDENGESNRGVPLPGDGGGRGRGEEEYDPF